MPKDLFQEIIFTIIMVIVMVYAMICYNIALSTGGMSNFVFLAAFKELAIMGPIAFVLDFFLVGKIAKAKAFKMVDVRKDNPFHLVIAISVVSVILLPAHAIIRKCFTTPQVTAVFSAFMSTRWSLAK